MADDWSKDIETGIDWMDAQHMGLVEKLRELSSAIDDGCATSVLEMTMVFLDAYVIEHFGDEEDAMAEYDYPDVEEHKLEHARFKVRLWCLQSDLASRNVPISPERVKEELIEWIVDHVGEVDMKLGEFLVSKFSKDELARKFKGSGQKALKEVNPSLTD